MKEEYFKGFIINDNNKFPGGGNNPYKKTLALEGILGDKNNILTNPDHLLMQRLAREEDDFQRVMDIFGRLVEGSFGKVKEADIRAFQDAHEIYARTQRELASAYAHQGQFDLVDQHLQNAHAEGRMEVGYRTVTLERQITDEQTEEIMNTALEYTPLEYFLDRVTSTSEAGNIDEIERSVALVINAVREQGVIPIPSQEQLRVGVSPNDPNYEEFAKLYNELSELETRAYLIAARKEVSKGIAYALESSDWSVKSDTSRLKRAFSDAKNLLLDRVKKSSRNHVGDATDSVLSFWHNTLTPMEEELVRCREDPNHPLRDLYQRDEEGRYSFVTSDERGVLPNDFYQELAGKSGIRMPIHEFYNPVARRYGFNV